MHRTARGPRLRLRIALAVALALGCTGSAHRETTVLAKVPERIVVLPFNVPVAMPAELEPGSPLVWKTLENYLRAQGSSLKTIAFPSARQLWVASIREAQAAAGGKKSGFDDALRVFVAKLKPFAEFDAVIMPSLFVQRAVVSGTVATWDGAKQTLEIDAGRDAVAAPENAPIEGAAPAASLHTVIVDADGVKRHDSRTGLVLLVRARMASSLGEPQYSFVPRRDPFADSTLLWEGIARGLAPFLPPLPPPKR